MYQILSSSNCYFSTLNFKHTKMNSDIRNATTFSNWQIVICTIIIMVHCCLWIPNALLKQPESLKSSFNIPQIVIKYSMFRAMLISWTTRPSRKKLLMNSYGRLFIIPIQCNRNCLSFNIILVKCILINMDYFGARKIWGVFWIPWPQRDYMKCLILVFL